ncbi:MAG: biotin synthase BioB [Candidatus Omnitrophica bacterium]|nr:biotin synthase BioB [Candidatus Omnitrophota bacterium]
MNVKKIKAFGERIIQGGSITEGEALHLFSIEQNDELNSLIDTAHEVFLKKCSKRADLCSLINAKSGRCREDCSFCAQSGHYNVEVAEYPLLDVKKIVYQAIEAQAIGAHRFCIVTSGGRLSVEDFEKVLTAFKEIKKKTNLSLDGSLGVVGDSEIQKLKEIGVVRYNHNLETSEAFFPRICTTHTFRDRYETVSRLKRHGLEVCCGGVIGLGEGWEDRVSLAFSLKKLGVDCVPINILNPRPGTPLAGHEKLSVEEIIKTISIFRLILPTVVIKIAGGREVNLGDAQGLALRAGANGIIVGGYLTTAGNPVEKDLELIKAAGLEV